MFAVGGISFVMGILWMLLYRDKKKKPVQAVEKKEHHIRENFKKVLKVKDLWLISAFFGIYNIGLLSLTSFLPLIFEERGMARAGESVAVILGTSVLFNIIGGVLSDKIGRRKIFLGLCAVIFGCCIPAFGILEGGLLFIPLVIAGAALGTVGPVLMAVPIELEEIGPPLAGTAIGFIFMLGNTGGFIGPVLSGKLMDITGMYWSGLLFMCAATFIAAGFIVPLRETGKRTRGGPSGHSN
jgi:nitrate/nitrite transporter NarK